MSESFVFCSCIFVMLTRHLRRQRARLCLNQRLTREFTLLENCMIYHQAEQVSQCDWTAIVEGVPHPLIGRLSTLVIVPAAWRQVSTSENHRASRSRERFVGSRAARSSEIRSLNVKQPTSTRLRLDRARSSTLFQDSSTSSTQTPTGPDRALSRGDLTQTGSHVHEMCRVLRLISALSRLGDLLKRPASLVLAWPGELASGVNCELSANTPRGLETCSGVIGHSYLH